MKQNVRLYIEEYEVDLGSSPDILFNYTETDLTNPTLIKNGYSKTVVLPGTQNNCNCFGEIWDLEREQVNGGTYLIGEYFNPAKKVSYDLYVDNEIVESGYVKMNTISRKKGVVSFNVTLYSSLGDFFYMLSYNDDGEKLKLSDLRYLPSSVTYQGNTYTFTGDSETEFDITISRTNLSTAWNNINITPYNAYYSSRRKYSYLNFAPCYNAVPTENFSADKVLINFSGSTLTKSRDGYGPQQGFALGSLPENIDEWGARDLRSYLQRPVLRVKGLIEAICSYANERGYNVELSPTFFSSANTYYQDTWLTMPMLTEMNLVGSDVDAAVQHVTYTCNGMSTTNGWYNGRAPFIPSETMRVGSERIDMNITFHASGYTNIQSNMLTSTFVNGERNFCAYAVQMAAWATSILDTPLAVSDVAWLTTKLSNGDYLKQNETVYTPVQNKDIFPVFGEFERDTDGTFKWSSGFTLTIDRIPSNAQVIGLIITSVANITYGTSTIDGSTYKTYGYRRGRCYTSSAITSIVETTAYTANAATLVTRPIETAADTTGDITLKNSTAGYSGAKVGKQTLLNTEHTPADYLISYCKQFGLYFLKSPYNKTVKILTRKEFYNDFNIVDIDDLIDRSDMSITPLTFDKKYYDMELESVGGVYADNYKKMYSRTYGSQRINTGYEYDTEPKNLLSGNTFKSCVQCVQKSKYYLAPIGSNLKTPSYIYQGFSYSLYNGDNTTTVEITNKPSNFYSLGGEKYYDGFDKPQFRTADGSSVKGENVLLFYTGLKTMKDGSGNTITYALTDDIQMMGVLNDGNSCWIYTENTSSSAGTICSFRSTIPHYSRYKESNSAITYSLDFGEPKQLYINNLGTESGSTLYARYWRDYINDIYDINNRVVKVKVQLEKRPSQELMRKWYWFDNCYWRLNKITNFNACSYNTTECEFIKVADISNYTM